MVSEATDNNTDPDRGRAMDLDRAFISGRGLDDIIAPGDNVGHPDECDPGGSIALRVNLA